MRYSNQISDSLRYSKVHRPGTVRSGRRFRLPSPLILLAGLLFVFAFQSDASAAEIVRVIPEYREEESFHRISEFFTGRENPGRRAILRSDPEVREGFYLKVRLRGTDRRTFPQGTTKVELALPDEQRAREFIYSLEPVTRRRPLVLIGITGDDWPEEIERPLAWKVSFLDSEGNLLDSAQSFLWSINPEEGP